MARRIGAARKMLTMVKRGLLGRKEVTKQTKLAVYKSTFLHILSYSSESWTFILKHRSQLKALEMSYLQKIERKTRKDRIRNAKIRANLDFIPAEAILEKHRLRWFGHLLRMGPDRSTRGRGGKGKDTEEGLTSSGRTVQEALRKRGMDWNRRRE
ncbi:uncharacterized protein [Halyomorpha halys]|uniref:uncharacterized protein n=1 Tax=Halyomorpha halys TaxID=286706 RepID=UPI0006D515E4